MKTRLGAFFERMSKIYEEDGLFHDTEVQANELIVRVLIANAIIIVLILAAVIAGVFPVSGLILPRLGIALVEILILGAISYKVKQDAWWLKYVLLLGLMTVYAQLDDSCAVLEPLFFKDTDHRNVGGDNGGIFCVGLYGGIFWLDQYERRETPGGHYFYRQGDLAGERY